MNPGEQLLERAGALLAANTRTATLDGRRFTFSVPSGGRYRFQWFWDSCFHAIVWARIDPERAAEELRSLLAWQRDDGFLPHVIFWDREPRAALLVAVPGEPRAARLPGAARERRR